MPSKTFFHHVATLSLLLGMTLPTAAPLRAQNPGGQDASFATGPQAGDSVFALALQPNGQVLVGGKFATFRGAARNAVARLNADGGLDAFNPGQSLTGYNGGAPAVNALALPGNGQVIVAGLFDVLGQPAGGGIARLNADGSLDGTFNVGTGLVDDGGEVGRAEALAVLPDGQILVGGAFVSFNGVRVAGLVRLNPDGSLDASFNPGGAGIAAGTYGEEVKVIAVQGDGRILIGGNFSAYDGIPAGSIARLNADGTPDLTFQPGSGSDYAVEAIALQADGRILVGGSFSTFDGAKLSTHLVRLGADGALDTNYYPANGVNLNEVDAILVQPDGKALVGGVVYLPQGLTASPGDGLARINPDGTQDTSFSSVGGPLHAKALALQPDGKVLLAANSYSLTGTATGDVYRAYDLTISPTPAVTLMAPVPMVTAGSGQHAEYLLTISAAQSDDLHVNYALKGTAANGSDYVYLKGSAKIKVGQTNKPIKVTPQGDLGGASKKTVKMVLEPGMGYTVGTTGKVKVTLLGQ